MARFNLEDLLEKTDKNGECLIWRNARSKAGYGQIWDGKKVVYVHRLIAELALGEIGKGQEVMHSCDVRSCVNPDHLSYGTRKQNMMDASRKGRLIGKRHVIGIEHPSATLTFDQIQSMRAEREQGAKLKELSKKYGISLAAISKIARKETRINA
jgi:hypothetical protein